MVDHDTEFIKKKRVLELGSGLGLCGILANCLDASSVHMTDGDTATLANLRENVSRNCPHEERITCLQLMWERHQTFLQKHGLFDTIIGSDIIYLEASVKKVWETVKQLLEPSGTFLLVSCSCLAMYIMCVRVGSLNGSIFSASHMQDETFRWI
jgi:predicted nicotinamide N-methyase